MDAPRISRVGILSACAVAVYVFESFLPVPVPWARIGLSNVVVILALFGFGLREALLVTLVRVAAGNLLLGLLLSPSFVMSLAGAIASVLAMEVARRVMIPPLSLVGASVLGAVLNNVAQIQVFAVLFTGGGAPRELMGTFMIIGAAVGLVTGMLASVLLDKVVLESTRRLG